MKFFLSAEISGRANGLLQPLMREYEERLNTLSEKNYGEALQHIGIIVRILEEGYLSVDGKNERRYYSRKNKETDMRLMIDYKMFIKPKNDQKKLYLENIIESVYISARKAKKYSPEFKAEELLNDVISLFPEYSDHLKKFVLEKYKNLWK